MTIEICAGWRGTTEFFERQCRDWADAFSEAPTFYDRLTTFYSSNNALVVLRQSWEVHMANWHDARLVWQKRGNVAEFMRSGPKARAAILSAIEIELTLREVLA